MKLQLLLISLLTLLLVSCDEKEWKQDDIALVPVYQVNELASAKALEVYQEKDLLLEYETSNLVQAFTMMDYTDASTDSLYLLSFARMDSMVVDSVMTEVTKLFSVKAEMANDTGIMNVVYLLANDTLATSLVDISVLDTEVYN